MNKLTKRQKKWIAILIVTLVLGALLIFSTVKFFEREGGISFGGIIRAETFYIIVIFLILIPIMLAVLLFTMLSSKNRGADKENVEILGAGVSAIDENGNVIIASAPASSKEEIEEEEETGERFCMLSEIDRKSMSYGHQSYEKGVSLESFCQDFRNYAASRLKLYYDIEDIRRFIAGLAVSKLVILQGMSGTGKTSLAHAFGSFTDNSSTVIPVQPMWKERTDLVGYYNEFTKRFNETLLLEKMYEANYSKDMYITVLDEMNIARVEYYFAEFLSLLELPNPEERYIDVVSDKWENDPKQFRDGRIKLPENMW
ncbi:MAG: AAA family ATPase, partial [Clostridia bacterium]|nr:AAA family ATPase [Clostridia bacterium]